MRGIEELRKSCAARPAQLGKIVSLVREDLQETEERLAEYLSSPYAFIQTLTRHLERFRGKRLRPVVLHLAARALGGEAPWAAEAAAVVEMVHLATLCHDDVLDEAQTRRRSPTLNTAWGTRSAILTGDLLVVRAFEPLAKIPDPRPIRILARAARLLCEGELLQVSQRFETGLREEEYLDLIARKTGALFAAAAELGAVLAGGAAEDAARFHAYGQRLGVAFQIVDDCLDLSGVETAAGKSLGADLRNGEATLPIIHLFAAVGPAGKRDLARLFHDDSELPTRESIAPWLETAGSIEYALGVAREQLARARADLSTLPACAARQALLELPDYILTRGS